MQQMTRYTQSHRFHENIVFMPTTFTNARSIMAQLMPTGVKNRSMNGFQKTLFFVELSDGTMYTSRPTIFHFGHVARTGLALDEIVPKDRLGDICFIWKIRACWDVKLNLIDLAVESTWNMDEEKTNSKQEQLVGLFEKGEN